MFNFMSALCQQKSTPHGLSAARAHVADFATRTHTAGSLPRQPRRLEGLAQPDRLVAVIAAVLRAAFGRRCNWLLISPALAEPPLPLVMALSAGIVAMPLDQGVRAEDGATSEAGAGQRLECRLLGERGGYSGRHAIGGLRGAARGLALPTALAWLPASRHAALCSEAQQLVKTNGGLLCQRCGRFTYCTKMRHMVGAGPRHPGPGGCLVSADRRSTPCRQTPGPAARRQGSSPSPAWRSPPLCDAPRGSRDRAADRRHRRHQHPPVGTGRHWPVHVMTTRRYTGVTWFTPVRIKLCDLAERVAVEREGKSK